MKYPQLVSTKAVNEISDWLIKRLEDLDIEHPGVYSRLLLSLLHTPLKVNAIDLFEDLKNPYRLRNKNNEELKRLAAVENLMELATEENKSQIVNLVDEIHEKLKKLDSSSDDTAMNARTVSTSSSPISVSSSSVNSKLHKNLKKIKRNHGAENPTKNYYMAFPALNSNKMASSSKTATTTSADKPLFKFHEEDENSESNFNLASWSATLSKLMIKPPAAPLAQQELMGEKYDHIKTPEQRRKQKRVEKGSRRSSQSSSRHAIDMQFATKSYDLNENATFSPKKMQMVRSNVNWNKKAKAQRFYTDSSNRVMCAPRNCDNDRNTNFSKNIAQNIAPMQEDGSALVPWDMDFVGNWEMDRDLISEFVQQQQIMGQKSVMQNKKSMKKVECSTWSYPQQQQAEEDDDAMLMKCLPGKLIDESLVDDEKIDPFNLKEALSISSYKSKFDENVKAIWNDCYDPAKPLTQKNFFDNGSNAGLANPFMSEKNSLGLFNFNEPPPMSSSPWSLQMQYHHHQQQQKNFSEVIAPPTTMYFEMPTSYVQAFANYDFNNNNINNDNYNHSFFNGNRGAIPISHSYGESPLAQQCDLHELCNFDFIGSGTNVQAASIWADKSSKRVSECLILKEVDDVDGEDVCSSGGGDIENDEVDSTLKNLSSIGTEMKQWQSLVDEDDEEVSLINHTADQSAFKKFKPYVTSTIIRANYHPLSLSDLTDCSVSSISAIHTDDEQESYLTSEKYHFSPIIRDGHVFAIDNNYEEIEYERSPSGGLHYNNMRYQVWDKYNEIFRNEALDLNEMENEAAGGSDKKGFEIKYLVKNQNDKACQTEEDDFMHQTRQSFLNLKEEYRPRRVFDEYFRGVTENNKWRSLNNGNDDHNVYSLFSVNRVKNNNNLTPKSFHPSSNSSSSSICTIPSTYDAAAVEDPFELWRNFNADQDHKHNCDHRLWEQCIKCARNDDDLFIEKPVPANRLLKDELKLDGDEIMSVIQNLYISSDYCDDDDEEKEDDCDDFDMNHVLNVLAMDDAMDGIEDENKFYEEIDNNNQKNILDNSLANFEDFDEIALTKMHNAMKDDQEKCIKFFKWIQSALVRNNTAKTTTTTTTPKITADTNNNECSSLSEDSQSTKNRKRRHSTCQNLMEKRCFDSREPGFGYRRRVHPDNGLTPTCEYPADLFVDAAKMFKTNFENILLITNDRPGLDIESFKNNHQYLHPQNDSNYNRNILQQQHALVKHLDLSRPLTR